MAQFTGMDIEQVEALSKALQGAAETIKNQVVAPLNGKIGTSESIWKGKDANDFRSNWESQHKKALLNVIQALEGASRSAHNNAVEQAQVSGR